MKIICNYYGMSPFGESLVGSLPDGTKEVVGFLDGERESKLSWETLLLGLKKRGLAKAPKLA